MFKRKPKVVAPATIQEAQTEFNQTLFHLGDVTYRQHLIKGELTKMSAEENRIVQKLDTLGKHAQTLQARAKAEVNAAVKAGGGTSNDQTTAKAS